MSPIGSTRDAPESNVGTSVATLDASNETKSYNVAQVYGAVLIRDIHIVVLKVFSNNVQDFYLNIWDGSHLCPISKATTLDLDSAPVGSLIIRTKDSDEVLEYQSGETCEIVENTDYKHPQTEFIVNAKGDGTPTYLRMTYTTTNTPSSGQIRGFLRWEPVTAGGRLEVL